MRAAMVLQVLASRYQVFLLVVPLYPSPAGPLPPALAALCHETAIVPPPSPSHRLRSAGNGGAREDLNRQGWIDAAGDAFRDTRFDVVHVFRLATLPFAEPYLKRHGLHRPKRHLDLDDIESVTRRRIGALYALNGNPEMAEVEEVEAKRSETREDAVLRNFHRVYVCSEEDRAALRPRAKAELCVLPNAVRLPEPPAASPRPPPFTFLFVGTLGYYPNEDAAIYFCREVLPLVRAQARRPFHCVIVGTGAKEAVIALGQLPEVEVAGAVPDLAPWYREADAVVVPIRAGGGTRIKILEAFSYRRPVVATSVGIEGIDADDGVHVLIADTPADLADRCLALMDDQDLRDRLTSNALSLLERAYTIEAVTRQFLASSGKPGE